VPLAISDWRYIAVSMLAGLITFYWFPIINRLSSPVLVFDAAGLALFVVAGAGKALAFQAGPVAATLLGTLIGIGGGMVRDILVMEIPNVLRTQLYAVAALIGAGCDGTGKNAESTHFRGSNYRRSPLLWTAIYCHATRLAAPHRAPSPKIGLSGCLGSFNAIRIARGACLRSVGYSEVEVPSGNLNFRFARRSAGHAIVISCCTVFPAARAVSK
jgi:Glycine transporter